MRDGIDIQHAMTTDDLRQVSRLFCAYEKSLGIDLEYQGFTAERTGLPGRYAAPQGALLLARAADDGAIGCVALRALDNEICEMKRLYVAPDGRELGVGRALIAAVIAQARSLGYREIRLDTLPDMAAAQGLYHAAGFEPTTAYYDTPVADTVFMRLRL